uniref:Uncharacterized protein n=1 Tax=Physcomitrium patens TaxID=3218 RepID=A0A2K1JE67_PHYPA|nr:hypothetical protein PHYPA_020107 [Physcomitrium patens]
MVCGTDLFTWLQEKCSAYIYKAPNMRCRYWHFCQYYVCLRKEDSLRNRNTGGRCHGLDRESCEGGRWPWPAELQQAPSASCKLHLLNLCAQFLHQTVVMDSNPFLLTVIDPGVKPVFSPQSLAQQCGRKLK